MKQYNVFIHLLFKKGWFILANKEIKLNINDLDKEYQMFLNEFKSLEELYDESKDLLDKSLRIATRSNSVFMAS